jgi:hypothetical protein
MTDKDNISHNSSANLPFDTEAIKAFIIETQNAMREKNVETSSFRPERIAKMRLSNTPSYPSSYYLSSK